MDSALPLTRIGGLQGFSSISSPRQRTECACGCLAAIRPQRAALRRQTCSSTRGGHLLVRVKKQDPLGDVDIAKKSTDKIDSAIDASEKSAGEAEAEAESVVEDVQKKLKIVQQALSGERESVEEPVYGANEEGDARLREAEDAVRQKAREVEEREPGRATGLRNQLQGNSVVQQGNSILASGPPHPLAPFFSGAALVGLGTLLLSSTALAIVDFPLPNIFIADVSSLLPRGTPSDILPAVEVSRGLSDFLSQRGGKDEAGSRERVTAAGEGREGKEGRGQVDEGSSGEKHHQHAEECVGPSEGE